MAVRSAEERVQDTRGCTETRLPWYSLVTDEGEQGVFLRGRLLIGPNAAASLFPFPLSLPSPPLLLRAVSVYRALCEAQAPECLLRALRSATLRPRDLADAQCASLAAEGLLRLAACRAALPPLPATGPRRRSWLQDPATAPALVRLHSAWRGTPAVGPYLDALARAAAAPPATTSPLAAVPSPIQRAAIVIFFEPTLRRTYAPAPASVPAAADGAERAALDTWVAGLNALDTALANALAGRPMPAPPGAAGAAGEADAPATVSPRTIPTRHPSPAATATATAPLLSLPGFPALGAPPPPEASVRHRKRRGGSAAPSSNAPTATTVAIDGPPSTSSNTCGGGGDGGGAGGGKGTASVAPSHGSRGRRRKSTVRTKEDATQDHVEPKVVPASQTAPPPPPPPPRPSPRDAPAPEADNRPADEGWQSAAEKKRHRQRAATMAPQLAQSLPPQSQQKQQQRPHQQTTTPPNRTSPAAAGVPREKDRRSATGPRERDRPPPQPRPPPVAANARPATPPGHQTVPSAQPQPQTQPLPQPHSPQTTMPQPPSPPVPSTKSRWSGAAALHAAPFQPRLSSVSPQQRPPGTLPPPPAIPAAPPAPTPDPSTHAPVPVPAPMPAPPNPDAPPSLPGSQGQSAPPPPPPSPTAPAPPVPAPPVPQVQPIPPAASAPAGALEMIAQLQRQVAALTAILMPGAAAAVASPAAAASTAVPGLSALAVLTGSAAAPVPAPVPPTVAAVPPPAAAVPSTDLAKAPTLPTPPVTTAGSVPGASDDDDDELGALVAGCADPGEAAALEAAARYQAQLATFIAKRKEILRRRAAAVSNGGGTAPSAVDGGSRLDDGAPPSPPPELMAVVPPPPPELTGNVPATLPTLLGPPGMAALGLGSLDPPAPPPLALAGSPRPPLSLLGTARARPAPPGFARPVGGTTGGDDLRHALAAALGGARAALDPFQPGSPLIGLFGNTDTAVGGDPSGVAPAGCRTSQVGESPSPLVASTDDALRPRPEAQAGMHGPTVPGDSSGALGFFFGGLRGSW